MHHRALLSMLALLNHWTRTQSHTCTPNAQKHAMPRLTAVPLYTAKCIYKHKPDGRHVHTNTHRHHSVHHQQVLTTVSSGQSVFVLGCRHARVLMHTRMHTEWRISIDYGISVEWYFEGEYEERPDQEVE